MLSPTQLSLIGAAFVFALLILAGLAYRGAQKAHAKGYDLGYDDANRGNTERITALHSDIERLHNNASLMSVLQHQEREAIMLDADRRIAIFARSASLLTSEDELTLRMAGKQLLTAAKAYTELLRLPDQARFAIQVQHKTAALAERIHATLNAPLRLAETTSLELPLRPRTAGHGLVHGHHFVVDLETESTAPNAAITAIGVAYLHVPADPFGVPLRFEFYARTEPLPGAHSDPETLNWWAGQSEEARAEVNGTLPRITLAEALEQLDLFMASMCAAKGQRLVWGNGSSFDNVILGNAYRSMARRTPWEFWNDRDLRTLIAMFPEAKQQAFVGIRHHALHDARHESQQLLAALVALSAMQADAEEETRA